MLWLIAVIVGAIIGLIAYGMSKNRVSFIYNLLFGVMGAIVGTWFFFVVLGLVGPTVAINFWLTILWSVVGAAIVLAMVELLSSSAASREGYYERRGIAHEYEPERRRRRREDEEFEEEKEVYRKRKR